VAKEEFMYFKDKAAPKINQEMVLWIQAPCGD